MLVITMNVIVILTAMAGAFLLVAFADNKEHQSAEARMKAFYIAEAGLSVALADVRVGGDGQIGTEASPISFNNGTYYTASIREGDVVTVVSIATYGGETEAIEGVIDQSPSGDAFFTSAAGGESSVKVLDTAMTDSYDSTQGSYVGAPKVLERGFNVVDSEGDVESNGTIDIDPTSIVYGDAETDSDGILNGSVAVFGTTASTVKRKYLEVVEPGLEKNFLGPVVMFGGSTVLPSGVWGATTVALMGTSTVTLTGPSTLVVGSLQVSDTARLLVDDTDGPVLIYVADGFLLSGLGSEVRATSSSPKSLLLYSDLDNYTGFESTRTGDPTRPLRTTGNANLYGVVYAPNGTINVSGTSEVFGSTYGESVVVDGGGSIHFDESLANIPTLPLGGGDVATEWTAGPGGYGLPGGELVTWRKVAPQAPVVGPGAGAPEGGGDGGGGERLAGGK